MELLLIIQRLEGGHNLKKKKRPTKSQEETLLELEGKQNLLLAKYGFYIHHVLENYAKADYCKW